MEQLAVPRLIISGTSSGVGKSLFMLGLAYELRRRSVGVSCVISGVRFSQATILKRLAGRYVRCLEGQLLTGAQHLVTMRQAGIGADIVLVEGQRGLFDGELVGSFRGSDAELAALTRSPVLLVVDASGFGQSLAAVYKGFSSLAGGGRSEGGFELAGVLLNRLETDPGPELRDREFYEKAFDAFQLSKPVGALPWFEHEAVFPGHQPDQSRNNTLLPRQFLVDLATLVSKHIDIDRVIECAELAPSVPIPDYQHTPLSRRCRIAVSDDSCFALGFHDNIELLRYYGAEVVPFSPVADSELPRKVGAIYLTGGFLPEYGPELVANKAMMNSISEFAERGGVVYSEGAGTAYLCRDYRYAGGEVLQGVGLIPISAVHDSIGFGYQDAVTIEETILGRPGIVLKGIGTGEWRAAREDRVVKSLRMSRDKKPSVLEGYSPGAQQFCTFQFFHLGSNPKAAKNIVDAAEVVESLGVPR